MHKENGYCEVQHAGEIIKLMETIADYHVNNNIKGAHDCNHEALKKMRHLRGFLHGEESFKAELMAAIKELAPEIATIIKEAMCSQVHHKASKSMY